ncbi:hypothetical protein AAC387_Pa02g3760 [Persea americana]
MIPRSEITLIWMRSGIVAEPHIAGIVVELHITGTVAELHIARPRQTQPVLLPKLAQSQYCGNAPTQLPLASDLLEFPNSLRVSYPISHFRVLSFILPVSLSLGMGIYRQWLETLEAIAEFRANYGISDDVLIRILGINLGVHDIKDVYNLCKFGGGDNAYYLRTKVNRECIVNELEDSNRHPPEETGGQPGRLGENNAWFWTLYNYRGNSG